jgi:hypothetical protein
MTVRIAIWLVSTVLALAMAAPVLAITTTVTIESATLTDRQTITLTGTIECSPGAFRSWYEISASVDQNGRLGSGVLVEQPCDGAGTNTWTLELTGDTFHGGWADYTVTGATCALNDPFVGTECATDTQSYTKFHFSH